LLDTDLDSGLLKRQYHEQEETEIVLAMLDTDLDSGLLKRQYHEQGWATDCWSRRTMTVLVFS
jgi:hypothetical protein